MEELKRLEEMNRAMMLKSKKYAIMQRPVTGGRRVNSDARYGYVAEEEQVEPELYDRQSDLSGE